MKKNTSFTIFNINVSVLLTRWNRLYNNWRINNPDNWNSESTATQKYHHYLTWCVLVEQWWNWPVVKNNPKSLCQNLSHLRCWPRGLAACTHLSPPSWRFPTKSGTASTGRTGSRCRRSSSFSTRWSSATLLFRWTCRRGWAHQALPREKMHWHVVNGYSLLLG